jgi:putative transposase
VRCPKCQSTAVKERPERTAQGYRRFRCLDCTKQFNERSSDLLNRTQYPSDVIALVVLWRLRYKLSLRDLAEMFLIRGFVFTYEAARDWEAKLTPALAEELRRSRKAKSAAAGTSTRCIFVCTAAGSISTARSIGMAPWST